MKRIGSFLLAVVLCLTLLPVGMVSASSGPMSLAELREKYPHGAYWNHTGSGTSDYTWNPCTHHRGACTYSGSCGCNTYKGMAIQCMGFAYQLASLAYDCDPRTEWSTNRSSSALDSLKAGDIVRYRNNGHSIFVIGVEGETVTYADGNSDNRCGIKWDQTTTKANLKATFTYVKAAPYALETPKPEPEPEGAVLTVQYHAGGGSITAPVTGYRYEITDASGVNLRKDAGTGNPVLTALPCGTEFVVNEGETKTVGGYTWGKTTYNGHTGWLVISDFVEQTATLREGAYYLSEDLIYATATAAPVVLTAVSGQTLTLGNPVEYGLEKPGCRVVGWSTQPEGTHPVYSWEDTTLTAETLCPTLAEGSATVTLYAVWVCDHQYAEPCAAVCTLCGEEREITHQYEWDCDPDCNLCGAVRETTHRYATPCAEVCDACGDTRVSKNHTFEENVCTVCGKEMVTLAITTQPQNGFAKLGERVRVTVEASGEGLTYQWYVKNAGQTTYTKSSLTTPTYSTVMSAASKDRWVQCNVYDSYGNMVQTEAVQLLESVSIITPPQNGYAVMGERVRVTVEASGEGLTYQWYVKNAGQSTYTKSSLTTPTYSTVMSAASKNRRVLCNVYDRYGNKVQTKSVLLREQVSILTQPKAAKVAEGTRARCTVAASGDDLRYVWYVRNADQTTYVKSSITSATYSVKMSEKANGRRLICYVYDKYGNKVRTQTVMLRMK